jgi:hypothetical protein
MKHPFYLVLGIIGAVAGFLAAKMWRRILDPVFEKRVGADKAKSMKGSVDTLFGALTMTACAGCLVVGIVFSLL